MRGFSEALRGELFDYPGIRVCDLFPAFLDTPGMQHAANYTGSCLKPAPPVYDPQRVARAIVSLAQQPKRSKAVGSAAVFLRIAHALLPGASRFFTAKTMAAYFNHAEPAPAANGNLFEPVEYGTSIHGGWNSQADKEQRKKKVARAAILGGIMAAGLIFTMNQKR